MNRTIATALALLAVLAAGGRIRAQSTPTAATAAADTGETVGVRDGAKMFSPEAVKEAVDELREVHRRTHWSAMIETVETLRGKTIKDTAVANATALKEHGLYVLMAQKEHKFYAAPSRSAQRAFSADAIQALDDTILNAFKAGKFDQGLRDAVTLIRHNAEAAPDLPRGAAVEPRTTRKASEPPATVRRTEPTSSSAPASTPSPARPAEREAPVSQPGSILPMILIGGGVVLLLLWLLSRAFRGSSSAPSQQYTQPNVNYGPAPGPGGYAPQPQPGYAPRPQAPPQRPGGYAPQPQPGYAPQQPQPGYAPQPQPGYGYPPPQQGGGGGGGFMSGVLGGAAGAVAGNILYDKFGRPHEGQGAPPHVPGSVVPQHQEPSWPQGGDGGSGSGGGVAPPVNPSETFDPNAGGGGDWGTPEPAADAGGAGGDWGTPEPAAEPDAGAGGDWGAPEPDAGADADAGGGDWGTPEPDAPADTGGGDWGGGDAPGTDDNQGGSW